MPPQNHWLTPHHHHLPQPTYHFPEETHQTSGYNHPKPNNIQYVPQDTPWTHDDNTIPYEPIQTNFVEPNLSTQDPEETILIEPIENQNPTYTSSTLEKPPVLITKEPIRYQPLDINLTPDDHPVLRYKPIETNSIDDDPPTNKGRPTNHHLTQTSHHSQGDVPAHSDPNHPPLTHHNQNRPENTHWTDDDNAIHIEPVKTKLVKPTHLTLVTKDTILIEPIEQQKPIYPITNFRQPILPPPQQIQYQPLDSPWISSTPNSSDGPNQPKETYSIDENTLTNTEHVSQYENNEQFIYSEDPIETSVQQTPTSNPWGPHTQYPHQYKEIDPNYINQQNYPQTYTYHKQKWTLPTAPIQGTDFVPESIYPNILRDSDVPYFNGYHYTYPFQDGVRFTPYPSSSHEHR